MFFGFTHCPDICPLTLQVMADTRRLMAASGTEPPRMVFISVDPERDDPKTVAEYVQFFHPEIVGLSGSEESLQGLYRALGVAVHIPEHEPGSDYEVGHSSGLFIVDQAARYRGLYRPPHDAASLAAELPALIEHLSP